MTDKQKEVQRIGSGKNTRNKYYYKFFFGARSVNVDSKLYEKGEPGEYVEMELSLGSETVLFYSSSKTNQQQNRHSDASPGQPLTPPITQVNKSVHTAQPDKEAFINGTELLMLEDEVKKRKNRWIISSLIWLIPFFIIRFMLHIVLLLVLLPLETKIFLSYLLCIPLYVLFRYMQYNKAVGAVKKDIAGGIKILKEKMIREKIISNAKMSGKYSTYGQKRGEFFYISTDDSFTEVAESDYHVLIDNKAAIFHVAPNSGLVLKIEKNN